MKRCSICNRKPSGYRKVYTYGGVNYCSMHIPIQYRCIYPNCNRRVISELSENYCAVHSREIGRSPAYTVTRRDPETGQYEIVKVERCTKINRNMP